MKKVVSLTRKAIEEYDMIKQNDRIAVGVSGGKDSLVLLGALAELSGYHPKNFKVIGISLDMGFGGDFEPLYRYAEKLGVEYYVKRTDFKEIIFDIRQESNPCSLCAKMRRGALNDMALEHDCKTVALGHHNDDVLETFFLSLLYEGRVNCFAPVTYLDRTGVTQIRPMIYVRERDIRGVIKHNDIPVMEKLCPADGATKREYVKELIRRLEKETTPGLRKRLFHAVRASKIDGWKI